MKLAVIDLDGVIVNADARFAKAEEIKKATWDSDTPVDPRTAERIATDRYWRTVFTPELVNLDTLIEGVNDALLDIQQQEYKVIFLASRPDSMRQATITWLFEHTVFDADDELVMKVPAFITSYTKTVVWKAGIIQTLAIFCGADELLVVDDEQANLNEITKYTMTLPPLTTAHSLAEAVAKLDGTWQEPDPFLPPEE